ncbi:MAG TPA: SDR family NAD(P)-dependent oxidoreductase [Steroidobacteraceae bacterium]|nr:SDR family NAD(P)-dependent oxidoreductase [Steroidobacteraceae bacterium]
MGHEEQYCAGRVAVVTGAGRGIGRAHALAFADAGAKVVVNDLGVSYSGEKERTSPADEVVDEIRERGGQAVANYGDIADWTGARALLKTGLDAFGRVDILVNNAAIIRPDALIRTSETDFDEVVRVNLKGTFCPTRAFAEHWARQAQAGTPVDASIICTTSRVGLRGTPYYVVYGCTKAAVAYFVEGFAAELQQYGIRVNGVAPRADTRMMGDATRRLQEVAGGEGMRAVFNTLSTAPPSEDVPTDPTSISPFVVWLASDRSKPVNGRVFSVLGSRIGLHEGWRETGHVELPSTYSVEDVALTVPSLLAK